MPHRLPQQRRPRRGHGEQQTLLWGLDRRKGFKGIPTRSKSASKVRRSSDLGGFGVVDVIGALTPLASQPSRTNRSFYDAVKPIQLLRGSRWSSSVLRPKWIGFCSSFFIQTQANMNPAIITVSRIMAHAHHSAVYLTPSACYRSSHFLSNGAHCRLSVTLQ